jgi:hypothetical protein
MNRDDVLTRLEGVRAMRGYWIARCPAHDEHNNGDANPSLTITERDGNLLVHCQSRHANAQDRVIEALRARGLWPAGNAAKPRAASKLQARASDEDAR